MSVETYVDILTSLKNHLPSTLAAGVEPGGRVQSALTHIREGALPKGGDGQGDGGGQLRGAVRFCQTHDGVGVSPLFAVVLRLGAAVLTAIGRQGAV